jgi:hypothetical protein
MYKFGVGQPTYSKQFFPLTSNLGCDNDMLTVYFLNLQTPGLIFKFWRMAYKKCFLGIEKDKIMK